MPVHPGVFTVGVRKGGEHTQRTPFPCALRTRSIGDWPAQERRVSSAEFFSVATTLGK